MYFPCPACGNKCEPDPEAEVICPNCGVVAATAPGIVPERTLSSAGMRIAALVLFLAPLTLGLCWWATSWCPSDRSNNQWHAAMKAAHSLENRHNNTAALAAYQRTLEATKAARSEYAMECYRAITRIYQREKRHDERIRLWQDAVKYFEALGSSDPYRVAGARQDLCCAYMAARCHSKAGKEAKLALALYEKSHHSCARSNKEGVEQNLVKLQDYTLPGTEQEPLEMLQKGQYDQLDKLAAELRQRPAHNGRVDITNFFNCLTDEMNSAEMPKRLELAYGWCKARPQSGSARVMAASILISWAWDARGSGWANTVTQEGWRLFEERITKAAAALSRAETLGLACPELYRNYLTVAQALGWDRERYEEIFAKAMKVEPGYYPFYFAKANQLLPRWHGAPGEMEAFAKEARDKRAAIDGDILYARIAMSLARMHKNLLSETRLEWPIIQRGLQGLAGQQPSAVLANWTARFAVEAQDRNAARDAFRAIGVHYLKAAWRSRRTYEKARSWALGSRGPADCGIAED
jgi:hypothetical protein